jgi:hypothetical protein
LTSVLGRVERLEKDIKLYFSNQKYPRGDMWCPSQRGFLLYFNYEVSPNGKRDDEANN